MHRQQGGMVWEDADIRHATVKTQDGALQTPNQRDVEVPACKKTFRAEDPPLDLFVRQGSSYFIRDSNVGTILAYE